MTDIALTNALEIRDGDRTALVIGEAALLDGWLEYERLEGASEATIMAYRRGMDTFRSWLREHAHAIGGPITPATIRQFKADQAARYSVQTVNLRLTAVRSFYRYLVNTNRIPVSPAEVVKGMKRSNSRRHKREALTGQEIRAVLATCDLGTLAGVRDNAILTLFAYCGLRTVEVYRASVGDLRTAGDRLVLAVQGKGRREADEIAVIPRDQEGAIRTWMAHRRTFREHGPGDPLFISLSNLNRGQRMSKRAIRGMVTDRFDDAGVVGDKSTHSLRHSAITAAIRAAKRQGRSPLDVQRFARHASFDTTQVYIHEVGRLDDPVEDLIDYGQS